MHLLRYIMTANHYQILHQMWLVLQQNVRLVIQSATFDTILDKSAISQLENDRIKTRDFDIIKTFATGSVGRVR